MIGKIFTLFLKIIPLITMTIGGYTSYQRANPLFGLGKVLITQRELANVSSLVMDHFQQSNEKDLIRPENFHKFLRENYNNQLTIILRNIFDMHKDDFSVDLWGVPLKYLINPKDSFLSFQSSGPDMIWESQDDIYIELPIDTNQLKLLGITASISKSIILVKKVEAVVNDFDQQGFNHEDFDHEGFDHEGYSHEGFDHQGFDHQGLDRNGIASTQNISDQQLQAQRNDQSSSIDNKNDELPNSDQSANEEVISPE